MDELLRGNYPIAQPETVAPEAKSLEDQFEAAALKRLGGSITFVARRKVVWTDDDHGQSGKA
jgi:hypothetical protein